MAPWNKSKASSSTGGSDVEPRKNNAAESAQKYYAKAYAEQLATEDSEEFHHETKKVVGTLSLKSQLRAHVGRMEIRIRGLESQLAIARATGGPTADIMAELTPLRAEKGRADKELRDAKSILNSEKMMLAMSKEQLQGDWPIIHDRKNFRR